MDSKALLVVAMALLVGLHGFAGSAMADTSATIELDAAEDDQEESEVLTFTFVADANETVTATDRVSRSGGNVVFDFAVWRNLDTGERGSSNSWTVEAGAEYKVTYQVTAESGASEARYTADVSVGGQASQRLSTTVYVREPQFGSIYTRSGDLVFESTDEGTTTMQVEVENTGRGAMKTDEITFSGVPSGFDVEYSSLSNEIAAGRSDDVNIRLTADSSVSAGTYQFQATVTDNLDNSETFTVSVDVTKPPVLGIEGGSTVDVGDVLVGGEKTTEFTITEDGGHSSMYGVGSRVVSSDQFSSISFGGLSYVRTSPGGEDTAEVTLSVDENAAQHDNPRWTVKLTPNDENGVGKRVKFTGRVIYPAKLGSLSMANTEMVFDEPKSQVSSQTETVTVEIPNEGDLEMDVWSVSARTDDSRISANVVDSPNTVGELDAEKATVELEADPETPEGTYKLSVVVDAGTAGRETITKDVEITHGVSLAVEKTDIDYGDVIVTKNLTESTDIAEELEYEDVSNLSVTKLSGPDEWLTVVDRPPETLSAGDSAPFVIALQFDTSAEIYREYTWTYRVSGEEVESRNVTVTATPEPYSFEEIRDPLDEHTGSNDWRAETAGGMVSTLDSLEDRLRGDDDVPESDLTTAMAAGRSTLLFVESVENARETLSSEGNEAAQNEVVRAAAAYNLLDRYVAELDDPELRSSAEKSRTAAEETVGELVESQTDHYQSRLESDEVSMIERAHINRQLGQLASLQGDEDRAERRRAASADAFDRYTEMVAKGNEHRQTARDWRADLRESTATVVFGQPVVLNPARWDDFDRESAAVRSTYDDAEASFEAAGATEEADRVRSERQEAANSLQLARYSLYGSTATYALLFVGLLGHLVRNAYAYVRDAREAVSGDFLLAS